MLSDLDAGLEGPLHPVASNLAMQFHLLFSMCRTYGARNVLIQVSARFRPGLTHNAPTALDWGLEQGCSRRITSGYEVFVRIRMGRDYREVMKERKSLLC